MGNSKSKREKKYKPSTPNTVDANIGQPKSSNEPQNTNDAISSGILQVQSPDMKPGEKRKKEREREEEKKRKDNKKKKKEKEEKKGKKKSKQNEQKNISEDSQGRGSNQSEAKVQRNITQNTGNELSLPQAPIKNTSKERLSNTEKEISEESRQNARKSKDLGKPDKNGQTKTNPKTSANQDKGHSNEPQSNSDKLSTPRQDSNVNQVKESGSTDQPTAPERKKRKNGQEMKDTQVSASEPMTTTSFESNLTTKTGTEDGTQQSLTGQKGETSGNVTRISVNKSDSQHSLTSPKIETSSSTVTSQNATTKFVDQKPIEANVSVSSGTSERDKKIVLDTGIQTDIKYYTESQYDKEHKEREEAERLLKVKEEEIEKLIAGMDAELLMITRDRDELAKKKQIEIARIQSEKIKLEKEKDELLTRLSAMAGRKLTDNNPNIADLSDLNRPTKLAEKFSELYDNAWTDAFSVVQEQEGYKDNEKMAVKVLLDILTTAYKEASKAAEEELTSLKEIIERFQRSADEKNVKDVMKQLKDSRKKKVQPSEDLKQVFQTAVEQLELDVSLSEKLKEYKDQCLDLCWLMVIQDPPVFLQCEACKEGDKFDKNNYREYTQGGDKVAFAVWPALFLEKGGALLSKGVVQCKKRPLSSSLKIKTGQDVNALESKPKSQSLKVKTSPKLEMPRANQTQMRKPDDEKSGNTQNSGERRNSSTKSEYF